LQQAGFFYHVELQQKEGGQKSLEVQERVTLCNMVGVNGSYISQAFQKWIAAMSINFLVRAVMLID